MAEIHKIQVIARIHSDFSTKFGIPRQSGLVPQLRARIVLSRSFGSPRRCGGWKAFPTSG